MLGWPQNPGGYSRTVLVVWPWWTNSWLRMLEEKKKYYAPGYFPHFMHNPWSWTVQTLPLKTVWLCSKRLSFHHNKLVSTCRMGQFGRQADLCSMCKLEIRGEIYVFPQVGQNKALSKRTGGFP